MPTNKKNDDANEEQASIFYKAFGGDRSDNGRPWTKEVFEEFLDVLYWLRVLVLAPLFGLICGVLPVEGALGAGVYVALSSLCIYVVCYQIVLVDTESFGGDFTLQSEGFQSAAAIFVLTWIITFTLLHSDVEEFYE
jgi:hypothetical protein